jgi:hypothetical protein
MIAIVLTFKLCTHDRSHCCCCCCCRYKLIEEKLQLSQYLDWTFVSCTGPMRVSARAAAVQLCCGYGCRHCWQCVLTVFSITCFDGGCFCAWHGLWFECGWDALAVVFAMCFACVLEGGDDILDFEVLQRINCGTDNEKIQNA